jgi:mRNA-degrading endonuclease RelE of RelBE toxin-antitoxin system
MAWHLRVAKRAQKELNRIPAKDRDRLLAALTRKVNSLSGLFATVKDRPNGRQNFLAEALRVSCH